MAVVWTGVFPMPASGLSPSRKQTAHQRGQHKTIALLYDALINQQLQNRGCALFRAQPLQHLTCAAAGLGSGGFHAVSAALGLDHFQTFGPRSGWLQRLVGQ